MLFASEALVVVAFALEQLLEVGFAVEFTLKSCKGAKAVGEKKRWESNNDTHKTPGSEDTHTHDMNRR